MKKNALPNSLQKRKLLFDQKIPRERIISYGEMFLRDGRLNEAVELFVRAGHGEGLEEIRALAIERGDSFLYSVAAKGSPGGGNPQDWETLGRKAMELKKFTHAVTAFKKAENADSLKTAEEAVKEVVSVDKA